MALADLVLDLVGRSAVPVLAGAQLEVQETGPLVVCHQVLQQDEVWRGCGSRNFLYVCVSV